MLYLSIVTPIKMAECTQGDQKVSVHLMITVKKTRKNIRIPTQLMI
jgi:hypothetical protein